MTVRLLLSNDDGFQADGLRALRAAVEHLGEVWVVAPEKEQSATSHSLSLHHPLRIREVSERYFAIDGTPADCVYIAVNHLMRDRKPTLTLSGINHGPNLAEDVIYSGTVAAAMEAAILGVPAIAFSLATRKTFQFERAQAFVTAFVQSVIAQGSLPPRMLLNVNIPGSVPLAGYQVTKLGRHTYGADVIEREDPRGRKYFWIGGTGYEHVKEPGTDVTCIFDDKRVSVSPIMMDLTNHSLIKTIEKWPVTGFQQF